MKKNGTYRRNRLIAFVLSVLMVFGTFGSTGFTLKTFAADPEHAYVLEFKKPGGGTYVIGTGQTVELETIVGNYRPSLPTGAAWSGYNYSESSVDDAYKLSIFDNSRGKKVVRVVPTAAISNGEQHYILINYSYDYNGPSYDTLRINVTVYDADSEGVVVAPKANEGLVANGEDQLLITAGSANVGTMQYKLGNGDWSTSAELKGKDAGDYDVYWRVIGDDGNLINSNVFTVTIAEKTKDPCPIVVKGVSGLVYGDTADMLTVRDNDGQTIQYSVNNGTWSDTIPTAQGKEAGTYTIEWKAVENQTYLAGGDTVTVTIAEKTKDPCPVQVTAKENLVYTGAEMDVLNLRGYAGYTGDQLLFSVDGGAWTPTVPKLKDAGTYKIDWKAAETDDYLAGEGNVTVTIKAANVTAPVAAENLVFNDTDQKLLASAGSSDEGTVYYQATAAGAAAPADGTDWVSDYTKVTKKEAGDYYVWYKVVKGDLAVVSPQFITASISEYERKDCPVAVKGVSGLVYGDEANMVTVRKDDSTQEVYFSVDNGDWAGDIPTSAGKKAGTYTIEWKCAENATYKAGGGSVDVTISDIDVTAPVVADGLVYDGTDQKLLTSAGSSSKGTVMYGQTEDGVETPPAQWSNNYTDLKAKGPGNYYVWYKVVGDADKELVAPVHITAVIADAQVGSFTAPKVEENLVYDGKAHRLIAEEAESENGTVWYALKSPGDESMPEDKDWTKDSTAIKGTDAGEYKVWYKIILADKFLVDPAAVPVTIGKAEPPVTVDPVSGLVYGDKNDMVTLTKEVKDIEVYFSLDGKTYAGEVPQNDNINAGSHTVAWKSAETDNYKAGSGEVTVNVDKYKITMTAPTGLSLIYSGEEQVLVGSGSVSTTGYKLVYFIEGGQTEEWVEKKDATKKDAGKYTVMYKLVTSEGKEIDADNFTIVDENGAAVSKSGSFETTIDKAPVTLKWTGVNDSENNFSFTYTGEKQGPKASVEGAKGNDAVKPVYDTSDTNLQVEPGKYTAKVTGVDNDNYALADSAVTTQEFSIVKEVEAEVVALDMVYGDDGTEVYVTTDELGKLDDKAWGIEYFYKKEGASKWESWGPGSADAAGKYAVKAEISKDGSDGTAVISDKSVLEGNFEITPRELTVRALEHWINYGDTVDLQDDLYYDADGLTAADEAVQQNVFKVSYTIQLNGQEVTAQPFEAGTYDIVPVVTLLNGYKDNYAVKTVTGKLHVYPASGNVVELTVKDYTYGETVTLPEATADYGKPKIVWLPYEEYTGVDDQWKEWSNADGGKPKDAGTYIVKAYVEASTSGTSYPAGEALKTFKINKKDALITIKDGSSVYSGEEVPVEESWAEVTGLVYDDTKLDFELVSDPAPIKDAGTYTVKAKMAEKANPNYNVTVKNGTYTVKKNKMVKGTDYTVDTKDAKAVFDGERHGIEVSSTVPDAIIYYSFTELTSPEGGVTNVDEVKPFHAGKYTVWYYIDSANYEPVIGSEVVEITKAYLRVKVADKEVVYGTRIDYSDVNFDKAQDEGYIEVTAYKDRAETDKMDYIVEESIEGLNEFEIYMDKDKYTDEMSDIGTYSIICSGLRSDDYVIRYTKGMLTIVQKPVHFSWDHYDDYEFVYDGKEHGLTAVVDKDDLVGTDKREGQVAIVYEDNAKYPSFSKDVKRNADWEVESYTAKVQSLRGPRAHNYKIDWEKDDEYHFTCKYKIIPVNITLTPNPVTTVFGDDAVWKGFTAKTLISGEDQDEVILGEPEYKFLKEDGTTEYKAGGWVGKYKIVFVADKFNTTEGLHAQNYQLSPAEGVMDVVKRKITLVWSSPKSFEYDGKYHAVKVEKAKNDYDGDSALSPELIYTDEKKVNAGSYTAVAKLSGKVGTEGEEGASNDALNYEIISNSDRCSWKITKRPVTIFAKDNTIVYRQPPKANGYYVDKKTLVKNAGNGNKLDSIGTVKFKFTYQKYGKPGNYKIIPVVTNLNPNYSIAKIVNAKLIVNYKVRELLVSGKASKKKAVRLNWTSVTDAKNYKVYFSACDSSNVKRKPKYLKTVTDTSMYISGLKQNSCYKYYVVACDEDGDKIVKSRTSHVITGDYCGSETNTKKVNVSKKTVKIKRGSTYNISSKLTKMKKNKQLLDGAHGPLRRYLSINNKVATVNSKGIITGISKGWCKVYVQALNGKWAEIEVYVK